MDYALGLLANGGVITEDEKTTMLAAMPKKSGQVAKFTYTSDDSTALSKSAKAEASNILGITKELNHDSKILEALADPSLYLAGKLRDKRTIDESILEDFEKDLATFKNLGMGDEEAISRAKSVASQKRSSLMAVHDLNYPTEANSLARRVAEKRDN